MKHATSFSHHGEIIGRFRLILATALILGACGSNGFRAKGGGETSRPQSDAKAGAAVAQPAAAKPTDSKPSVDAAASGVTDLPPGGHGGGTVNVPATLSGVCNAVYRQSSPLSCNGTFTMGADGARMFDLRSSPVTGSIDNGDGPTSPGASQAALVLQFVDRHGSISDYKTTGPVNWGVMPMSSGSFQFNCQADGTVNVVELEQFPGAGIQRQCIYSMQPVQTTNP